MENFLKIFPEHRKSELYLTGESYAGTYTAFLAKALLERTPDSTSNFPALSGIAISSPWLNPHYQYHTLLPFALKHDLLHDTYLVFTCNVRKWPKPE
jgi:carboxypeptidase C (cathepsin A)